MIFKGSKDIKGISRLEIISAHFQTFFFVEGFLDLRIDLQNGMLSPPISGLGFLSLFVFHLVLSTIIIFVILYGMLKLFEFFEFLHFLSFVLAPLVIEDHYEHLNYFSNRRTCPRCGV